MKHEKFRFKSAAELREKAASLGIDLPWSDSVKALLQPADIQGIPIPNRMVVQPMEGFDCDADGTPGELAFRRYRRYAAGGSGMIWFEAVSVAPEGRSNPRQMMITSDNVNIFKELVTQIRTVALQNFGQDHRPFLVIQLTHSGRYSKPYEGFRPKIFSANRYLDDPGRSSSNQKRGPNDPYYFSDSDLDLLKQSFTRAIALAEEAGFDAVDVKACHGYLLHEMLFAFDRTDSRYGGSFENRTRFLRDVLAVPTRMIKAVRLSGFDAIPHPWGFGMSPDGSGRIDLEEVKRLIAELAPVVPLWNISAGVPRYNSFVGRPFDRGAFNGPAPDEHPLTGIDRLIRVTGELQQAFPELKFVGTAYSWLRQYFPYVGAGVLDRRMASFIGLGRSSFAYPDAVKDLMDNGLMDPRKTCTSCSKCTESMRLETVTGCAVRDEVYSAKARKQRGEEKRLAAGIRPEHPDDPNLKSVGVLVVGSGAAALNAAIRLWESGTRDILIVTEQWGGGTSNNAGSDKQTYYKLSLDPGVADSAREMAQDICRGGAMHGDIALCEAQHSVQAFYDLVRLGVPFPHDDFGAYPGYKTDHDPRARATSAGPLTSHLMFEALARKVLELGIPIHDRTLVFDLITRETVAGTAIAGAAAIRLDRTDEPDHGLIVYAAERILLATGGPAGMYRDSVYPESQTGSTGMALKAGACAQNLGISQFGLASVKFRWNLSGSYQQVVPRYFSTKADGSDPLDFLADHFPNESLLFGAIFLKGYQWPFDPQKVDRHGSSNIDLLVQRERSAGRRVFIDFTRNPDGYDFSKLPREAREYLEKSEAVADTPIDRLRLLNQPAIDLYLDHGIDLASEPLEIAVCAQHCNGGLTGDIWWESNIRGLFPIGEVNGSHGITRPGGSALNAGQVGGIRAAMKIRRDRSSVTGHPVPLESDRSTFSALRAQYAGYLDSLLFARGSLDHRSALAEIRNRMSDHAGPLRNPDAIGEEVGKAWLLWERLHTDLKAVGVSELPELLRVIDTCLTHAVYLEAIAGELTPDVEKASHILEISLDKKLKINKKWISVRPVPKQDLWFENVWKSFRSTQ